MYFIEKFQCLLPNSSSSVAESKNILNSTLKNMGRLDKMLIFNALMIVTISICVSLVPLWRDLGQPIFLESVLDSSILHRVAKLSGLKNKD